MCQTIVTLSSLAISIQHLHEVWIGDHSALILCRFAKPFSCLRKISHTCESNFGVGRSIGTTLFNLTKLAICYYNDQDFVRGIPVLSLIRNHSIPSHFFPVERSFEARNLSISSHFFPVKRSFEARNLSISSHFFPVKISFFLTYPS